MKKYGVVYRPLSLKYDAIVCENGLTTEFENALLFDDYSEASKIMKDPKYCKWTGYYFIASFEVKNEKN